VNVILVRPFNPLSFSIQPPLGLGYLSATLKARGVSEVFLYDAVRHHLSDVAAFAQFVREKSPHLVGIQFYSSDVKIVREYLRCVKQIDEEIMTVVGGAHPSALPERTLTDYDDLDFVIAGEAELGLPQLVDRIESGSRQWEGVAGLAWRDSDGHVHVNPRGVVQDINHVPWPDWEQIDPSSYPHAPLGGYCKAYPIAPIIISRGCPFDCAFCAAKTIYGKGFRFRDVDDVAAEVSHLIRRFGVKEIMIQDDNVTFKKDVLIRFCERMAPLGVPWNCLNGIRLNCIDDDMVKSMKSAGCYAVAVGIESGSQGVLDSMNKHLTLEVIEEKVALLARHGLKVTGLFIVGYPTETREDVLKTIELAKRLPIDRAAFASFLPLPGSRIHGELEAQGLMQGVDFSELSYYRIAKSFTPHISDAELSHLLKKAIRSFHLRPKIIYRTLRDVGSVANLYHLARRFVKNYI